MARQYNNGYCWDYVETNSRAQAATDYHECVPSALYAMRFPDGTIKIGCTTRIDHRLASLRDPGGGAPELLAIKPGTFEDEKATHDSLVDHLDHGREWYRPEPEVLAVINGWRDDVGMEPLPVT